jgi:hypothetical protein
VIVLTYLHLNNPSLKTGLAKLRDYSKFSPKTAYSVGRISAKIEKEIQEAHGLYLKIKRKHQAGVPEGQEAPAEVRDAFEKDMDEFLGIAFDMPFTPIPFESLEGVGLTPAEILALEPCFSGVPNLAEEKAAG